jgi:hypothetical protein
MSLYTALELMAADLPRPFEPLLLKAIELGTRRSGPVFGRKDIAKLGEGWVGDEAFAIGVACALAYQDDPARGIWVAANHKGDSDSTAAIAGQLLGASCGFSQLPVYWRVEREIESLLDFYANAFTMIVD